MKILNPKPLENGEQPKSLEAAGPDDREAVNVRRAVRWAGAHLVEQQVLRLYPPEAPAQPDYPIDASRMFQPFMGNILTDD